MNRMGGAAELFGFLEQRGLRYAVLGDTRGLPQRAFSDIDLVLERAAGGHIARLVHEFCAASGFRIVQCLQHEITAWYFVLARCGPAGEIEYLAPDFCTDYHRSARCLIRAEQLVADREPARDARGAALGFHVCASRHAFLYYFLKRLDKGDIGARHGSWLSAIWAADPAGATRCLREFGFSREQVTTIAWIAECGGWNRPDLDARALRRRLHALRPRTARAALLDGRRRVRRLLEPTGLCVALLGPDGAGKSTLIDRLSRDVAPAFRQVSRFHLRPRLLQARASPAVDRPHSEPPRGALFTTGKLGWLALDYIAGHALRIRPRLVRSHCVLFDRHAHDLAIDPVRYRIGGGAGASMAAWLARVLPQPQLWLVLDAQPDVVHARKAELPAVTTAALRGRYLHFAHHKEGAVVIDANHDEGRVAAQATDAVLRRLAQRTERRLARRDEAPPNPVGARLLLFFCRHRVPVLSRLVRVLFNSDIYCRLPEDVLMPHPYGIVVHSATRLGRGVTLMQQVTLGGKEPGHEAAPTLGDAVYVGAGARVLGNVMVGAGATIGANAVVTRDVPPGARVVGANRILREP